MKTTVTKHFRKRIAQRIGIKSPKVQDRFLTKASLKGNWYEKDGCKYCEYGEFILVKDIRTNKYVTIIRTKNGKQ